MAVQIKGTTYTAEVDANNNLKANLPITDVDAGFASMLAENDAGTVTGSRAVKAVEISNDFRTRVGVDSIVFCEGFPGANVNTTLWQQSATTMTTTSSGGFVNLNAGLSVASGATNLVRSYRHFPVFKQFTTAVEMEVQIVQAPQTGNKLEWGLFLVAGTAAPTDGVFFRIDESGGFKAVICFNGTETESSAISLAQMPEAVTQQCLIYIASTSCYFWINNILVATIANPATQAASTNSGNLPISFRNYNVSGTSAAQVLKIGAISVAQYDANNNKPWSHIAAGAGAVAAQGQTGGTLGSTALYSNSLAAGAGAAATNTTAALGSGLGGQFSILPTLAVGTDGIISSYQVPVGTAALPGRSLYITGVKIQGLVTTVLAGNATPVNYAYSLAFGHTAVSLATAEAATTKAPRRIPLGFDSYAAAAAVGTISTPVEKMFNVPICVYPGEFIQVVGKNLGAVTTTGVITLLVTFEGYWE